MTLPTVDVIIPVLHRPQNVAPLLHSLYRTCPHARPIFVGEIGDHDEKRAVTDLEGDWMSTSTAHTFAEKVNYALSWDDTDGDWVLLVGDDVLFHDGWFERALFRATPDVAVIGTNDLQSRRVLAGTHATHPLIRREYIDEIGASWDGPGIVCHEGYSHCYVDDEIVAAAKCRKMWGGVALDSVVEHVHPMSDKAPMDDVYELGQANYEEDGLLFQDRYRKFVTEC